MRAVILAAMLLLLFFQSLSALYLPTLMADIVDTGVVKNDTDYIMRVGVFILLVAAAISALTGDLPSFIIISTIVLMSAVLDTVQEYRAEPDRGARDQGRTARRDSRQARLRRSP